jgi:cell division transport system permease protein
MNSFSSSLINMRRSPYQSLTAILLLSVTFFVGYTFSMVAYGSDQVLRYFETRPQVNAFFVLETDPTVVSAIATNLEKESFVTSVDIVSQEDAFKDHQDEYRDDPLQLELVTAKMLPASLEISANGIDDLIKIKEMLADEDSIDDVVLPEDIIEELTRWTNSMRVSGLVALSVLGFTSLLLMITMIGMKVVTKRSAINIMRIIGATPWFIRSPFVFEGMLYGLISSLIGWSMMMTALLYSTPGIKEFLGDIPLFPIDPVLFAIQFSTGTLIGMVLGALAGSLAVSRVMRK